MADYDRTDMPDENNTNFYADDFGESLQDDEVLPERGETGIADDLQDDTPFYEQSPTDIDESYPSEGTQDLGLSDETARPLTEETDSTLDDTGV